VLGACSRGMMGGGERKGGHGDDRAPFIGDTAKGGVRLAVDAPRRRGVREGRGAGVAVGWRGVADRSPTTVRERCQNRGGQRLTGGAPVQSRATAV
jgi:hypothetical protein